MRTITEQNRAYRYLMLSLVPLYFIVAAVLFQPVPAIFRGLVRIIVEPDFLITDYMAVGGIGAALVNASVLMLVSIWFCYELGLSEDGHTVTSAFLMFGFSLFGKNIFNIWAILFGVFLYARYHRMPLSRYIYIGLYGTSLSPIVTQMMYIGEMPYIAHLAVTIFTGVAIGFVLPPLAAETHLAHKGYSLYNVGFAAGITATVVVSVLKSFGLKTQARLIWSVGNNVPLFWMLMLLFAGMILIPGIPNSRRRPLKGGGTLTDAYARILMQTGRSADFMQQEGGRAVMVNMGINGIFTTLFILLVGGDLNGPTIGAIFTAVGFSATGKHIRNITPVMIGASLASLTGFWEINSPSSLLAVLFSTTLAPIAGDFGRAAGMIGGFLHVAVAMQIGILYDGMNLYNNGFAGGIIAVFMVPVTQSIRDRRAIARGEKDL